MVAAPPSIQQAAVLEARATRREGTCARPEPRRKSAVVSARPNSAQEATSEDPGLRRELRSRLSAPNRYADSELDALLDRATGIAFDGRIRDEAACRRAPVHGSRVTGRASDTLGRCLARRACCIRLGHEATRPSAARNRSSSRHRCLLSFELHGCHSRARLDSCVRHNSAQEATSEDRGLRRQLRSRLSAPSRSTDQA